MTLPANGGRSLLDEIDLAACETPNLWFLGHAGFILKYRQAIVYVDPFLSDSVGRLAAPPIRPEEVTHAGLVLATHAHRGHLDPRTVTAILESSRKAKLVLPKSAGGHAHSIGVDYHRMVTTNADLRVEFLDDRIYAVPSAHPSLDWTSAGGYPYLGYLVRFGNWTIYHAGDCVPYEGLAAKLRPYNVSVALLPVNGRGINFDVAEAAQLAGEIGAHWFVPMHYGVFPNATADVDRIAEHMLERHPAQAFKIFEIGERWAVPG